VVTVVTKERPSRPPNSEPVSPESESSLQKLERTKLLERYHACLGLTRHVPFPSKEDSAASSAEWRRAEGHLSPNESSSWISYFASPAPSHAPLLKRQSQDTISKVHKGWPHLDPLVFHACFSLWEDWIDQQCQQIASQQVHSTSVVISLNPLRTRNTSFGLNLTGTRLARGSTLY
jgi:hypothetical protein